jgi:hypothetical protein
MHPGIVALAVAMALSLPVRAQEMQAPTYAVGDQWTYRESDLLTKIETARITETVTAVNATDYWIDARRTARTWWRGDSVTRVPREQFAYAEDAPDQRGKIIATNNAGCAYPWPLKPGMKFECTEMTLWPNGWKVRYELKFKVEGSESLDTPAGRFDTLRLVAEGFATNETNNTVSGHERVIWLAPAIKREVKQEIRTRLSNGRLYRVEGRDLVEFKKGAAG